MVWKAFLYAAWFLAGYWLGGTGFLCGWLGGTSFLCGWLEGTSLVLWIADISQMFGLLSQGAVRATLKWGLGATMVNYVCYGLPCLGHYTTWLGTVSEWWHFPYTFNNSYNLFICTSYFRNNKVQYKLLRHAGKDWVNRDMLNLKVA